MDATLSIKAVMLTAAAIIVPITIACVIVKTRTAWRQWASQLQAFAFLTTLTAVSLTVYFSIHRIYNPRDIGLLPGEKAAPSRYREDVKPIIASSLQTYRIGLDLQRGRLRLTRLGVEWSGAVPDDGGPLGLERLPSVQGALNGTLSAVEQVNQGIDTALRLILDQTPRTRDGREFRMPLHLVGVDSHAACYIDANRLPSGNDVLGIATLARLRSAVLGGRIQDPKLPPTPIARDAVMRATDDNTRNAVGKVLDAIDAVPANETVRAWSDDEREAVRLFFSQLVREHLPAAPVNHATITRLRQTLADTLKLKLDVSVTQTTVVNEVRSRRTTGTSPGKSATDSGDTSDPDDTSHDCVADLDLLEAMIGSIARTTGTTSWTGQRLLDEFDKMANAEAQDVVQTALAQLNLRLSYELTTAVEKELGFFWLFGVWRWAEIVFWVQFGVLTQAMLHLCLFLSGKRRLIFNLRAATAGTVLQLLYVPPMALAVFWACVYVSVVQAPTDFARSTPGILAFAFIFGLFPNLAYGILRTLAKALAKDIVYADDDRRELAAQVESSKGTKSVPLTVTKPGEAPDLKRLKVNLKRIATGPIGNQGSRPQEDA